MTDGIGNQRQNRDYIDHSSIEIGQNTEKSLGDLKRLAATQIPVKEHLLKLARKTHNEWNDNININNNTNQNKTIF